MSRPALLHRLQRLRSLPASAQLDLAWAQLALIRAHLTLRFRKKGALLSSTAADTAGSVVATSQHLRRARELAVAVRRAAVYGPLRSTCLARAIATCWLLRREDLLGAAVRVGVQLRAGRLVAHAWVEYAGERLAESESDAADVREVGDLTLHPGP